jgi:hypothetical protein
MLNNNSEIQISTNANESMNKCKTRLVVKGCAQTYDRNYEKTYSLVVKMTIVKAIIVMAIAR